jgi:hypothetical protein
MRKCVWAAARHWNDRLGYNVFRLSNADTIPVTYLASATECIVTKQAVIVAGCAGCTVIAQASPKNYTVGENTTTGNAYYYNTGFDIQVNPTLIDDNRFQTDIPIWNAASSTYTYTQNIATNKMPFYAVMAHEMGHGLGLGHDIDDIHDDSNPGLDKEIMYWATQPAGINPANRVSLTTGNGHSLVGAKRILTDSRAVQWTSSTYGTFSNPVATPTLTTLSTNHTICGIGNSKGIVIIGLQTNPNVATATATYQWEYNTNGVWSGISNSPTFANSSTNNLVVTQRSGPYNYSNPPTDSLTLRCSVNLNGCTASAASILLKSSSNVLLYPTPSRCTNGSVQWEIPAPQPAKGSFTAYNMSTPTIPIINIISGINATNQNLILNRTLFAPNNVYKIEYNTNPNYNTVCPVTTDYSFMSTLNCTNLTARKLYINEVYRSNVRFLNGGSSDPCRDLKLHFSAFGNILATDSLFVKLSDKNGLIDTARANIAKRIVGRYKFAAASNSISGVNDTLFLQNIPNLVGTTGASSNYRVQVFFKRGTAIEWGAGSPEVLIFSNAPTNGCITQNSGTGNRKASTTPELTFSPDEIRLYPNPTSDRFTLEIPDFPDGITTLSVIDIQGHLLNQQNVTNTVNEVNTSDLPVGMYYLFVTQGLRREVLKLAIIR